MALHHGESGEVMPLTAVSDEGARTTALIKTSDFEAIQLVVRAGETIPEHRVAGSITLYCIAGAVAIICDCMVEMRAGDWLYLGPGTPHALRAEEDTSLLLTILFDRTAD